MILSQIVEGKWQDQGCLKFEQIELELNWTSKQFEVQFVQPWLKGIFISVTIIPHHFWVSSRVVCIMFIEIKLLFHILLNKLSIWKLRLL